MTQDLAVRSEDSVVVQGISLPSRIRKKIAFTDTCWLWTGAVNSQGYGNVWCGKDRGVRGAHRVVYQLLIGPIEAELTLDHLCKVPLCVNPEHLEQVTLRENLRRGDGFTGKQSRQQECIYGHPLSGENLYEWKGHRGCKICRRRRCNESARRRRERERTSLS